MERSALQREPGWKNCPSRRVLGKMIPFVVEAHGKLAPMAETITSYLITRQAKVIEEKRDLSPSAALRQASEQFWEPLACQLLTASWLGLAHCASWPRVRHAGLDERWTARLVPPQFCTPSRWTARRTPPPSESCRVRIVQVHLYSSVCRI